MLGKFNSHYSLENGIVYRPDFPIYLVYVHTTCSNSLKDSPVFQKPELLGHPFLTLLSQGGFITKNPLNYFSLKVTKFHGDSVKNQSARTKITTTPLPSQPVSS